MTVTAPVSRRVPAPISDALVKTIVAGALKGASVRGSKEVGIVFVGDSEMKKLNAAYRGKRKTTDVLSFGDEGRWPATSGGELLGDVVISVPQARRQAAKAKHSLRDEIAVLLVHGCLHLLGYDHVTIRDEKIMMPLQSRILKKLGYA